MEKKPRRRYRVIDKHKKYFVRPDLSSASLFFNTNCDKHYLDYWSQFKAGHPIMWYLWYKWWCLYSVPYEDRLFCADYLRTPTPYAFVPSWTEFAMRHPIQCLVVLLFNSLFEFTVRLVTSPIQMIRRLCKSECSVMDTGCQGRDVNNELAAKHGDMP